MTIDLRRGLTKWWTKILALAITTMSLQGPIQAEAKAANAGYLFIVRTGDIRGAGTDADLRIRAKGTKGALEVQVDNPGDDNERGDREFYVVSGDVGTIQELWVMTREESATPNGPDWYLANVKVYRIPDVDSISGLTEAALLLLVQNTSDRQPNFKLYGWIKPAPFASRGTSGEWTVTKLEIE